MQSKKLEAVNSLPVTEFLISSGECEYVLADATPENIETLMLAGFTAEQIEEAKVDVFIEISMLAFLYTEAEWWSSRTGFLEHERGGRYA